MVDRELVIRFIGKDGGLIDTASKSSRELKGLGTATDAARRQTAGLEGELSGLGAEIKGLGSESEIAKKNVGGLGSVLGGLAAGAAFAVINLVTDALRSLTQAAIGFVAESINLNRELRSVENALTQILGSTQAAGEALDFLRQVSDDTGQSQRALIQSYQGLSAAADSLGISQALVNELTSETARVSGILGLTQERTGLTFQALTQIISKGVVSMEELRQQLGEQLPVAFAATADGLGITTAELNELVSSGNLTAQEFIPAFIAGLRNIEGSIDPANAAIARFDNQILELQQTVGRALQPLELAFTETFSGILEAASGEVDLGEFAQAAEQLQQALADNPEVIDEIGRGLGEVANILTGELIDSLNFITEQLRENPEAISQTVDRFVSLAQAADTVVRAVASIVTFVAQVVSGLNQSVDAAQGLPIIGDAFAGILTTIELILDPLGAVADGINAVRETLARLRGETITVETDTAPIESLSDAVSSAASGVAQAQKNIAQAQADAASATDDGTGAIRTQIDSLAALGEAQDRAKQAIAGLEITQRNAAASFAEERARILASGGDESALAELNQRILESDEQLAHDRIAALGEAREQITQAAALSPEASEAASDELLKIDRDLAQARETLAEATVEQLEAIEADRVEAQKRRLEDLVEANESAIRAIDQAQAQQLRANRARELQGADANEIAAERVAIEQRSTQSLITEYGRQQAALESAIAQGTVDAGEASRERLRIERELGGALDGLLDSQIEAQRLAREQAVRDIEQQFSGLSSRLESETANIQIQAELTGGELDLLEARRNLQRAITEGARDELEARLEAAEASGNQRDIEQVTAQIERAKVADLLAQQQADRETLRLKQEQATLTNQERVLQAELNQLQAEQNLLTAQAEGADEARLRNLQAQLEISEKQLTLARQTQAQSLQAQRIDRAAQAQQQSNQRGALARDIDDPRAERQLQRANRTQPVGLGSASSPQVQQRALPSVDEFTRQLTEGLNQAFVTSIGGLATRPPGQTVQSPLTQPIQTVADQSGGQVLDRPLVEELIGELRTARTVVNQTNEVTQTFQGDPAAGQVQADIQDEVFAALDSVATELKQRLS